MRLRAASPDDFDAARRLLHEINPENGALAARVEDYQAILDHPGTTIWLAGDAEPIACATLHILPNMSWGGAPYAVVENVGVSALRRGAGVGKALIGHLVAKAERAGCWKIMVQTGARKGAAGFYRACGFTDEGRSGFVIGFDRKAAARPPERMSA